MGGRRPKPTAIKRLTGADKNHPERMLKNEMQPTTLLRDILPPEFMTDGARAAWDYAICQCPEGVLTSLDVGVFSRWCVLYDQMSQLAADIKERGTLIISEKGTEDVNPSLKMLNQIATTLTRMESEMGFTPASRTKISVKPKEEKSDNPFDGL